MSDTEEQSDKVIDFEAAKKEDDEERRRKITEWIRKNTKSF